MAPREQAKDKHVARQTGEDNIYCRKYTVNDGNGIALKNIKTFARKDTFVKLTKDYVKSSAGIESASPAEY